ncbi:MAG: hypothetical protein QOD33_770 [Pyrinomonadaceae bacterium]|jgi:hypothetical protein|nr:hypothetical protein [Pyrinomonadaceae bacterium]
MQEVSTDKTYLPAANLQTVVEHAAMPYIPFKSNSKPNLGIGYASNARSERTLESQNNPLAPGV